MLRKSYRLIIILFCFIVFTGCSAEYNVNISKDKIIIEDLNIYENDSLKWNKKNKFLYNITPKEYLNMDLKWPTPSYIGGEINPIEPVEVEGQKYYDKKNISNLSKLGINYNNKFGIYSFKKSNILNTCYDIDFINDLNEIYVSTKSSFKCFEKYKLLDDVKVVINTNCTILKDNSDSKYENKLIWKINKNNYINKKISFKLDCKKEVKKTNPNNSVLRIIYFSFLYSLIILLIILLIKILSYSNNKI